MLHFTTRNLLGSDLFLKEEIGYSIHSTPELALLTYFANNATGVSVTMLSGLSSNTSFSGSRLSAGY